jgi:hypothetical protein
MLKTNTEDSENPEGHGEKKDIYGKGNTKSKPVRLWPFSVHSLSFHPPLTKKT